MKYELNLIAIYLKQLFLHPVLTLIMSTSIFFIEKYLFDDWQFIMFLMILVALDTITGIWAAFLKNKISSKTFGKVITKLIVYGIALIVSHSLINYQISESKNELFGWIDSLVYAAIMVREAISVFENLGKISPGLIPSWILKKLKDFDDDGEVNNSTQQDKKEENENL